MQTPKARAEIKELELDLSKDRRSAIFFIKLYLLPIFVQIGEPHVISTNSDIFLDKQTSSESEQGSPSSSFICEKLSFSCEFGHNRYFLLDILRTFSRLTCSFIEKDNVLTDSKYAHIHKYILIFMAAIL